MLSFRGRRMPDLRDHDCLSFSDALFLYLEREGMPLNVASVSVFEGTIPLKACIRFVESKLPIIPRYRQRVVVPPLNIGLPTWEADSAFDVRNHIRQLTLRHGTEAELKTVASQVLSANMDRSRPLWDLTLLRGLPGNRTAIVTRVHHCLADGLSGVGLMSALMDPSPSPPPAPVQKHRLRSSRPRDAAMSLLSDLINACFTAARQVLTAQSDLLHLAQRLVAASGKPPAAEAGLGSDSATAAPLLEQMGRLLPELASPAERLPFNVICHGPQKFNWTQIPLADIKALKHACGATVNDVLLTLVTSAVRRYLELHGEPVRGRRLRIVVPVSVRGKESVRDLGNRITFLPVSVPLDSRRPRKLVAAVQERMAFLKGAHVAELVGLTGTLLGTIPTSLQALVGPIASQLPLSVCNLICTNVPGPKDALYLLGHKMLSCYPYVPIGGEMGMNCALLTYNGTAYFGFTADARALPDLEQLPKFLDMSFADMQKALGLKGTRLRRARKSRRPTTVVSLEPQPKPPQTPPVGAAA